MNWFISQVPGVFIGVLIGLIVNYVWHKYLGSNKKKERVIENNQKRNLLIDNAIGQIDYNLKPGVGCPKCHFKVDAIENCLKSSPLFSFKVSEIQVLRKLIQDTELCNSYGGIRQLDVPPGGVKQQCSQVKELLSKLR